MGVTSPPSFDPPPPPHASKAPNLADFAIIKGTQFGLFGTLLTKYRPAPVIILGVQTVRDDIHNGQLERWWARVPTLNRVLPFGGVVCTRGIRQGGGGGTFQVHVGPVFNTTHEGVGGVLFTACVGAVLTRPIGGVLWYVLLCRDVLCCVVLFSFCVMLCCVVL